MDELLQSTDYIRYSTTLGTNALVERKGPQLGLLVDSEEHLALLCESAEQRSLFRDLIADRIATIDLSLSDADLEAALVAAVNRVATLGASRILLSINEPEFKRI